jgi:hypothetical protein
MDLRVRRSLLLLWTSRRHGSVLAIASHFGGYFVECHVVGHASSLVEREPRALADVCTQAGRARL